MDIVIRRAFSRVWWTGQPGWYRIDEAEPPRIPVGAEIHFFIPFVNEGRRTRSVDTRATITDPAGRVFTPNWYPEPTFPRDLPPGTGSARAFFFVTQTPGVYSLHFEVLADGAPSDRWTFPACIAVGPAPRPVPPAPPETPPEIGALANVMGMVLVAELVGGLAEVMAEGMVEMMR